MALSVAVQMDPIAQIDIRGDTTFALMLEAQKRGHSLFYYEPRHLSMEAGRVFARMRAVSVADEVGRHYELDEAEQQLGLEDFDVVLMRQDPPFDMAYISATHLLERVHPKTLVVNDPAHVRNAPEKLFVTEFSDLMPETLISRDIAAIRAFREEHRDIILKPLYGNGGAAVFRISEGDENLSSLIELFETTFREPFVVQRYLPEIRKGDKRIIIVDGEPAGAINRIPAVGDARSNMHVGGKAVAAELTDRDREICARIGPELKARGFILVGIDVIGDVMTEINVTSPTGIRELQRFSDIDAAAMVWDAIEQRCKG
ncbi:glutathione synthase [Rhodopseudomonas julia]|uniref:Glutathione synthetase n=1 Tax=Rhodopseudomonas julia TaxID=200617 RepID=A0ABU0C8K1_9BRAD|nr:glutathione synthase [Rhodopseudomonas julia]MDQ0325387.1 glutathione synthase [Rhodopseudomonas julia]